MFVDVKDIKKTYGTGEARVEALRGVCLGIEEKEFIAVCGPSGSGKSTLLTIMAGLAFATVLTLVFIPVLYAIFFRVPYRADG